MVVKNEADIIEYTLTEALKWATNIFVLDNGSTDGTWDKVKAIAIANQAIVPWKQLDQPFSDSLRALVFNEFRHVADHDDWWCMRLDADEFYVEDPRDFLRERVKPFYNLVCSRHIQYQLTDVDLQANVFDLPVPERISRLRYFSPVATSEVRFFRHRKRLRWLPDKVLPRYVGMVSPERILVRHYQFRSLEQIKLRIATRLQARKHNPQVFIHSGSNTMSDYIARAKDCVYDEGSLSAYSSLPLANNQDLSYSWWMFLLYRVLGATRILP
jgi:glycosyltransferase involved in cell wall biosynthesis